MYLTLGQVARELGMNKPTLSRYIKSGKISAERQDDGSYRIDPSEMDRLRSLRKVPVPVESPDTGELTLLRALLAAKDAVIEEKDRTILNLAQERDEWREQCKKQLLLLSAPQEAPKKRRWWRW